MKYLYCLFVFFLWLNCNSQSKLLPEFSREIYERVKHDGYNAIIISRSVSHMSVELETGSTISRNNYKLFFIQQKGKNVIVQEYHDGDLANTFEIKQSNLFNLLKPNFKKLTTEKLKDFEYDQDGSKVYTTSSDNSIYEFVVRFNNQDFRCVYEDVKLNLLSNSKLIITKIVKEVEKELKTDF